MHISFICTGNICRSPMAALVFREQLRRAGLDGQVEVSSAGTGPWHVGEPADPRTGKVLADHGYPTEHVAAQIDDRHLDADLLVAMDAGHLSAVRRLADDPSKVRLMRSFDPGSEDGAEVPDPYYGGPNGFEDVLAMVEAATPGLLDWVRERL
ncbi:protein-tyrosine phosphatase [Saccharopolyspora antimicrobica]|uniref:protein-tyrosine-phosphatase n=1 Tax=Saccharopolyspora antimicrobica TaxID=455193 RepID=A0A1I4YBQ8_9PSEU|nr:low molecular weight protein-tyrosine-phosphatase [Saccharopolyspora antimicrobica]RKT82589.1 protein-tyrosine phosphatase [Saccharopolyspora antimicrobica]SFN35020.1 protein-tyrosine phosphatase [Saccharopolyspora antimicrobica]